jgi:hypothetical protein
VRTVEPHEPAIIRCVVGHRHCRRLGQPQPVNNFLGADSVRVLAKHIVIISLIRIVSSWAFFVPLIGALINLGILYWKRHSHRKDI